MTNSSIQIQPLLHVRSPAPARPRFKEIELLLRYRLELLEIPSRGGTSDQKRTVYQAAPGQKVVIKGSEVVKGWHKVQEDTWKVSIPNSFFTSIPTLI